MALECPEERAHIPCVFNKRKEVVRCLIVSCRVRQIMWAWPSLREPCQAEPSRDSQDNGRAAREGGPSHFGLTEMRVRIGTAGWSIASRYASEFPAEGMALERYAQRLSCAEINSSFYRSHVVGSSPPGRPHLAALGTRDAMEEAFEFIGEQVPCGTPWPWPEGTLCPLEDIVSDPGTASYAWRSSPVRRLGG